MFYVKQVNCLVSDRLSDDTEVRVQTSTQTGQQFIISLQGRKCIETLSTARLYVLAVCLEPQRGVKIQLLMALH